jgi:ABC-2 type transport system ATP-binding protein
MATIEIENLSKSYRVYHKQEGVLAAVLGLFKRSYREVHAVRNISLNVEQGEFVAFLGPNGAGKTTTLKLLSGVINPDSGNCNVMGFVPWERSNEYRRRFALVMGQKNQLWWDLPAMESFRLHQHIYGIDPQKFERTRDELSEMLDVTDLLGQPVRELSLGERMKMELIAALLHSPDVLFLDEPTIGLDVVAQHKIQIFLREYQQERKNTIILTSHYMKDIAALCKRVVIIANGSIYHDGSLDDIADSFLDISGVLMGAKLKKVGERQQYQDYGWSYQNRWGWGSSFSVDNTRRRQQVGSKAKLEGANQAREIMREVTSRTGEVRQQMTSKYQIDF